MRALDLDADIANQIAAARRSPLISGVPHFARLTREIDATTVGAWRGSLSQADIEIFQRIAGRTLRELGYSSA